MKNKTNENDVARKNCNKRKRAVYFWRVWHNPFGLLLLLPLAALFILLWDSAQMVTYIPKEPPDNISLIFKYTIDVIGIMLFLLLGVWLIGVVTTPNNARFYEGNLVFAFPANVLQNSHCYPKLVKKKKNSNGVTTLTFYSLGIPLEKWKAHKTDIQDALICNILDIGYGGRDGNNSHLIVLQVTKGVKPVEREAPVDPNFK